MIKNMVVFLWLEISKIMLVYETNEDFQKTIDAVSEQSKNYIQNQNGFKVMIERNTPYWR